MIRLAKFALLASPLAAALPAEAADPGVKAMAEPLFHVGPLPVTNSMVMTWLVAVALIAAIRLAVGRPRLVPSRRQAAVEELIVGVRDIVDPIVGRRAIKASFPLLLGLFIYILIQNWSGLIPGVGTVLMRSHTTGQWTEFVRPAHADMNGTLALALLSFAAWLYIVVRYAGLKAIYYDLFGNKADKGDVPGWVYYPLFPIFFAVGLLEVISILFRPVSLSFRLYGNMFGGENLLHSMSAISRWGLPIPFYFMEVLVGLVQAFIFTLLVSVYIGLLCNHGDDHDSAPGHAPAEAH